ncbi:Osteocalcin 2 like [Actinidia chinensis var. chinensis]|uniref:Osteocalcin 2 like n=1 Tax=Actinidia chinensis var. chinensis TaxID=1590841 RepID=A0A2R6PIG6_ACTCC|nr:Osteocalcin 2 like [Actinidia chinensis var. chinensis]
MSIVGDFDLNSMQGHAGSPKDVIKQTMLTQEVIFREQVHELHRLYWTQKTLMEDSCSKELDGYKFWTVSTQSTFGRFMNSMQYSPLTKEETSSKSPMLAPTPSPNKDVLEENCSDFYRLQHRPCDLRLPADQHVNRVGNDFLEKGNGWDLRKSLELKHQFYDDNLSYLEGVKLTLSIGEETRIEGSGKSTWYGKSTHSSSRHVIDLEESTDTVSNDDSKSVSTPRCVAPISGDRYDLRVPVHNRVSRNTSVKKDLPCWLTSSYSLGDGSEIREGQNSFNQGFEERHGNIACNGNFIEEKLFTSNEAFGFDLNRAQPDEYSAGAFDGIISSVFEGILPTNPTTLRQDEAANPTLASPCSKISCSKVWSSGATFDGISHSDTCPIDLESMLGPLSETCDDLSDYRKSEGRNVDLLLKSPKENYTDVAPDNVIDGRKEDTSLHHMCTNGSGVEDANSNKSSSSCKFDGIADGSSSGAKSTQSGTDFEGSNISPFSQFRKSQSSQIAETQLVGHELRSCGSSELKHRIWNKKKEELTQGDSLIQKAAESLVLFSLGSSTRNQDCRAKAGSNGGIEIEGKDQPQHSLDSYEKIVLKLEENNADDYCVSSKPVEVNELDVKDCGMKLRRGRRMKDFQRDVLPGLASLSRHEIREDVNIMEAVIRSREYKRNRSKLAGGGNWFAPVKSRRSRLNYVGRRYYS